MKVLTLSSHMSYPIAYFWDIFSGVPLNFSGKYNKKRYKIPQWKVVISLLPLKPQTLRFRWFTHLLTEWAVCTAQNMKYVVCNMVKWGSLSILPTSNQNTNLNFPMEVNK